MHPYCEETIVPMRATVLRRCLVLAIIGACGIVLPIRPASADQAEPVFVGKYRWTAVKQ